MLKIKLGLILLISKDVIKVSKKAIEMKINIKKI